MYNEYTAALLFRNQNECVQDPITLPAIIKETKKNKFKPTFSVQNKLLTVRIFILNV